jgi:hypothetical protein
MVSEARHICENFALQLNKAATQFFPGNQSRIQMIPVSSNVGVLDVVSVLLQYKKATLTQDIPYCVCPLAIDKSFLI